MSLANSVTTAPIIAASYERVSTRRQGQYGFSLGAQHQSLEDFTQVQGWRLPEHLRFRDGEDENASGADWDLPGLTAMLEAARRNEFQTLVVPDFDRFARSLTKGLVLEEQLKKYGVRVVFQRVPVDDTPEGRLMRNQLYSFAEFEREKIGLRTTMGRRAKARQGMVVGHKHAPYGYVFTYEDLSNGKQRVCGLARDSLTCGIVARIFDELRYRSAADVAARLNADNIPSPSGNTWTPNAVYGLAIEPVYCGHWLYGRNHRRVRLDDPNVIAVAVPEIISVAHWHDVQQALAARKTQPRGRMGRADDPYLLRGMLTCGHCGAVLHARPNYGRYYRCACHLPAQAKQRGKPVCALPDVHAVDGEAELWRIMHATLLDPDYLTGGLQTGLAQHQEADRIRSERMAAIETQLAQQRRRLEAHVDKFVQAGDGEFAATIRRRADEIEALITQLTAQRAELAAVRSDGLSFDEATAIRTFADDIRAGLAQATREERRHVIELLDVRGTVHLDPDGIKLGRKHRFRIEWQARIPLRDRAGQFQNWYAT